MKTRLACVLLLSGIVFDLGGQTTTVSQISGIVQDASGAAVAGAQVTVTNTDTDAARTAVTASDGAYAITNLVVGPYRLQVTKDGFSTYNQSGIVLQVNTNPQINVVLKIGAVTEQVEVQANAGMVETQNTSVGQVIDQRRVVDLPLNGRNVTQLITLSGGAVSAVNPGASGTTGSTGGIVNNLNYPTVAAFSIAGGQGNATNYLLDGGSHMDPRSNVGLPLPFPDALQEFKVETSSLPANYGSHPGGVVNAVTRSGSNSFHGDLFEFLRNGNMNARNFFAASRDSLKRNQFGGVLGGPIVKDKVFFFGGFQGTTERTAPATVQAFVPTAAVLQGNFQTILTPPCQRSQVNLNAASGAVSNVIPQNRLNPIALKFLALFPISSDPCGKILYGIPTLDNEYQGIARVDWQRTQRDSIFFRYYVTDYALEAFYDKSNLLTAANPGLLDRVTSTNVGDTYLLNARMVSSFRLTYARSAVQRIGANGVPNFTQLGSDITSPIADYTGQISASNYFSTGAIPGYIYNNIYGVSEDIAWSRGSHQISFGFVLNHLQMNGLGPFQMNPRMTFNGQLTGNALADLITGNIDIFLQGNGQVARDRQNSPSLYLQDNWKLSPRLQINAGLRWDPFIPQHQILNYASTFDPAGFYGGRVSKVYVNAPPGLAFPGDAGFPGQSDVFPRYGDFAPRLGLVLDPRGKGQETIRAGYGIFYDSSYLWNTLHVPLNPPWGNTLTLNAPPGGLSNPWQSYPGGNPFPTPVNPPNTFQFPVDGVYVFEPEHAHATYLQQWNVSVQKQLGADWLLTATYLGNKTTHQWLGHELNPAIYSPGATTLTTEARRLFNLANPATGKYFGSTIMVDDSGNASYNGLLLAANHRFSHNFSVLANYTLSHCLDQGEANQDIVNMYQNPSNRRAEWGNCAQDRRQLFNLSLIAQTPKFSDKWIELFAGKWQASGIFTYQTGTWLTVTDGTDVSLTGLGGDRPNAVGNWQLANPRISQWFNTSEFAKQASGTFGNAGRSVVLGPSAWNLDTGLWRTFPIRERVRVDARFEAFNVLNHTRFNVPVVALNAGNFGQITSARDPRILQVAMKLTF
jgi:Flp pilus assembly protein TadG